jgi:tetratricopeptide (TPR) repeat protein
MIAIAQAIWSNYFQVGEAALVVGDSATAETMFREALMCASTQALEPVQEADSALGLALSLLRQRAQRAEAQQLLRKAIRIYTTVSDLNCEVYVISVTSLADSYCCECLPERALPLLKQAVKVVAIRAGLAAPQMVPLFKRMALIYSEKNYCEKAEAFFLRAVQNS